MRTLTRTVAFVIGWMLFSTAGFAQQAGLPQSDAPSGMVSLIGCVERLPATPSSRGNASPAYKLIDVQPGAGTRMQLKPDAQFLLSPSKTMTAPVDLGKLQNQRVEISGTIAAAPAAAPVPPSKPGEKPAEPLPTLLMATVKSVSTECK
jgi:hypothetical protein